MTRHLLIAVSILAATSSISCGPPAPKEPMKVLKLPTTPKAPPYTRGEIDASLQEKARAEIAAAFTSQDNVLRAQALEAMSRTCDPDAPARIAVALSDSDPLVRFAAAMAAGDLKLAETAPKLHAMANDSDENVRVAVRYALHRLGDVRLSHELSAMSQSTNTSVRKNVAMVLGLLGNSTAPRVLMPMLKFDSDQFVRLQAAEALWRLGDMEGLRVLAAGLVNEASDIQVFSVLALAGPKDARVKPDLLGKLLPNEDDVTWVELQLAAARALGQIGADEGILTAVEGATKPDPRQRAMAALALGDIRRTDAQPTLANLLEDKSPNVRIAAALALRTIGLDPK
ncbi:MAG: HEAT repeat domain-containing protein [Tepidisphaeraceae bacterium]